MKQLTFAHEINPDHALHQRQLAGIAQLAAAVGSTLGPRGRNVVIDRLNNDLPIVTKDGVTVSKHVLLTDPVEHAAVKLVQHVAETVVRQAGDGTTTSIVLAEAIFRQGLAAMYNKDPRGNPQKSALGAIALQRALLHAGTVVSAGIRQMAIPVETDEQILAVATIAMNGDTEVPPILLEAVRAVGRDGMIRLADSPDTQSHLVICPGYRIPSGFVNDQFITNPKTYTAVLDNPLIFITERLLTGGPGSPHDVTPICEYAMKQGRPLLIVCDDMVGDALVHVVQNHLHRGNTFRCCVVRAPGGSENRRANLSDLGMVVGAEINRADSGELISRWLQPLKARPGNPDGVASHLLVEGGRLGECERATVTAGETVLEGCPGPRVDPLAGEIGGTAMIESIAADLLRQAAEMSHQYPREAEILRDRATRLTGRVAVVQVGASTEAAARPLRDSVEDAVQALRAALEEGVVPGGGSCLLLSAEMLRDAVRAHRSGNVLAEGEPLPKRDAEIISLASELLASCLESPLRQICRNAGVDDTSVVTGVIRAMTKGQSPRAGYDAVADEVVADMLERGIADPAKVVRIAMEMALSVAALLLSTSCSITWLPQGNVLAQAGRP